VVLDYLTQARSRGVRDEVWAKRQEPLARSQSRKVPVLPLKLNVLRRNLAHGGTWRAPSVVEKRMPSHAAPAAHTFKVLVQTW